MAISADKDWGLGQLNVASFSIADPCLALFMKVESALKRPNNRLLQVAKPFTINVPDHQRQVLTYLTEATQ